jgi:hypothetical protein
MQPIEPFGPSEVVSRCMERLAQIADLHAGEQVVDVSDGTCDLTVRGVSLDAIICLVDAASLPWVRAGLIGWRRTLRPGGRVGLALYRSTSPGDPESCRDTFREAGFDDIDVRAHVETLSANAVAPAPVSVIYAVAWNGPR